MIVVRPLAVAAPLTTGHPYAPGAPPDLGPAAPGRIAPAAHRVSTEKPGGHDRHSVQKPARGFYPQPHPVGLEDPHSAPPTVLQLRIAQLLHEQAVEDAAKKAAEKAAPVEAPSTRPDVERSGGGKIGQTASKDTAPFSATTPDARHPADAPSLSYAPSPPDEPGGIAAEAPTASDAASRSERGERAGHAAGISARRLARDWRDHDV